MKPRYLFEFCDQQWIPTGARECLFEAMEACNSGVRSFNRRVAKQAIALAKSHGLNRIVEVGAGRAPITVALLQETDSANYRLIVSDLVPNVSRFEELHKQNPERVFPVMHSMDLMDDHKDFDNSVLVLAVMMHHVPFSNRVQVLQSLSRTSSQVLVAEPIMRNALSILLCFLAYFVAFALPITRIGTSGTGRRLFWCWLVPIVPTMFVWDGVVSCLRQWNVDEWKRAFQSIVPEPQVTYDVGSNSLSIRFAGTSSSKRNEESQTMFSDVEA